MKIGDKVSYPDWTGLKTNFGTIVEIGLAGNPEIVYYTLDNGDVLDEISFAEEGAKLVNE